MGRKVFTEEQYNQLREAFSQNPAEFSKAAKAAGCDRRTAKIAWSQGFPKMGLDPIVVSLERERMKARADLVARMAVRDAEAERKREDAIRQAAEARADEGEMVKHARKSSLVLAAFGMSLIGSSKPLLERARETSAHCALPETDPKYVSPRVAAGVLRDIVSLEQSILSLARQAMEMERLHLGEPTQKFEVIMQQEELSAEEADTRLETVVEVLELIRNGSGVKGPPPMLHEPEVGEVVSGG